MTFRKIITTHHPSSVEGQRCNRGGTPSANSGSLRTLLPAPDRWGPPKGGPSHLAMAETRLHVACVKSTPVRG
jgi:hypothetical protein